MIHSHMKDIGYD